MFKIGEVVVFNPDSFSDEFWNGLSEEKKIKYFGDLGYGQDKLKFFVYITGIIDAPGHCVLISLSDQKVETMRHTDDFRRAREDEF